MKTTKKLPVKKHLPLVALAAFAAGASLVLLLRAPRDHATGDHPTDGKPDAPHDHRDKELWTCGMHPRVIQDKPGDCPICHMKLTPLRRDITAGDAPGTVTIDPAVVQNMGVRLAKVEEAPLTRTLRLTGFISVAAPHVHDVTPRVAGWVGRLRVSTEGQAVAKGEKLFELKSPELQAATDEAIVARRAADAAPGNPATAALRDAALRRLAILGLAPADAETLSKLDRAPEDFPILSPATGRVLGKIIVEGSPVRADTPVFAIADHRELWLDGQAFETDLPFIAEGADAEAEVAAIPGKTFSGKITFLAPQVDALTRTAPVRMTLPNPDGLLRPGMYATLRIRSRLADRAVLAPLETVLDTGERRVAFVAKGGGRFEPRVVRTGPTDDAGRISITAGLSPGEEVVSGGRFLIDSESRMKEALAKFVSEEPAGRAGTPPGNPGAVSAESRSRADATLAAYLALSARLGEIEPAGAGPADPGPLAKAAGELARTLGSDGRGALASRLADAAEKMRGATLADQRDRFKRVSAAQIALVKTLPPSDASGLFLLHCPMAKADWLQKGDTPANPYYASDMKECAEEPVPVSTAK